MEWHRRASGKHRSKQQHQNSCVKFIWRNKRGFPGGPAWSLEPLTPWWTIPINGWAVGGWVSPGRGAGVTQPAEEGWSRAQQSEAAGGRPDTRDAHGAVLGKSETRKTMSSFPESYNKSGCHLVELLWHVWADLFNLGHVVVTYILFFFFGAEGVNEVWGCNTSAPCCLILAHKS